MARAPHELYIKLFLIFKYARDYIAAVMSVRPSEIKKKKKVVFFCNLKKKYNLKKILKKFGSRSFFMELEPLKNFINSKKEKI